MLDFKPTDCRCMICKANEDVEQMKIVRDSGDSLVLFGICVKCQCSMGTELMEHTKTKEPNNWKQFLGDRFGKVN